MAFYLLEMNADTLAKTGCMNLYNITKNKVIIYSANYITLRYALLKLRNVVLIAPGASVVTPTSCDW